MELAGGVGPTITPTTRPGSMYDGDEGGNTLIPQVKDGKGWAQPVSAITQFTLFKHVAALQAKQAERQQSDR